MLCHWNDPRSEIHGLVVLQSFHASTANIQCRRIRQWSSFSITFLHRSRHNYPCCWCRFSVSGSLPTRYLNFYFWSSSISTVEKKCGELRGTIIWESNVFCPMNYLFYLLIQTGLQRLLHCFVSTLRRVIATDMNVNDDLFVQKQSPSIRTTSKRD